MSRNRPFVSLALTLVLALQGYVVSAVHGMGAGAEAMTASMPCHGTMDKAGAAKGCCDSGCPDVASCAMGCALGPVSSFVNVFASTPVATTAYLPPIAPAIPPQGRLRPPITLHA